MGKIKKLWRIYMIAFFHIQGYEQGTKYARIM